MTCWTTSICCGNAGASVLVPATKSGCGGSESSSTSSGTMMTEGRYREIAEYCLRDVKATVLLYNIWRDRLSGIG